MPTKRENLILRGITNSEHMKIITNIALVAVFAVALLGCRDRAAEKKIAELESRLAQLEGNKTPATTAVSPAASNPTAATGRKAYRATPHHSV